MEAIIVSAKASETGYRTTELDKSGWYRLEVDGHYMGMVHAASGVFCLFYRGKRAWFDLAEIRRAEEK
jgi:hypothetical protein